MILSNDLISKNERRINGDDKYTEGYEGNSEKI